MRAALSGLGTEAEAKRWLLEYMAINTRLGLGVARPLYLYDSGNLKVRAEAHAALLQHCVCA